MRASHRRDAEVLYGTLTHAEVAAAAHPSTLHSVRPEERRSTGSTSTARAHARPASSRMRMRPSIPAHARERDQARGDEDRAHPRTRIVESARAASHDVDAPLYSVAKLDVDGCSSLENAPQLTTSCERRARRRARGLQLAPPDASSAPPTGVAGPVPTWDPQYSRCARTGIGRIVLASTPCASPAPSRPHPLPRSTTLPIASLRSSSRHRETISRDPHGADGMGATTHLVTPGVSRRGSTSLARRASSEGRTGARRLPHFGSCVLHDSRRRANEKPRGALTRHRRALPRLAAVSGGSLRAASPDAHREPAGEPR
jgi:hypothetical protein